MMEEHPLDALAREQAQADQASASGAILANLLVSFHNTLRAGDLDVDLSAELTTMWFSTLLGNVVVEAVDEDDD